MLCFGIGIWNEIIFMDFCVYSCSVDICDIMS